MFEKRKREGNCFGCDKTDRIVNRTKWLCPTCNSTRLQKDTKIQETTHKFRIGTTLYFHNNKQEEYEGQYVKVLSQLSSPSPIPKYRVLILLNNQELDCTEYDLMRNKPIPKKETKKTKATKQAKKESNTKQQLSVLKKQIEDEALDNDTYFCKGCGASYLGLDKSHILSVGQRKDLELEKENIDLLCRDCHMDWESGNVERLVKLDCIDRYLDYIYKKDTTKYFSILAKLEDYEKEGKSEIVRERCRVILLNKFC